MALKRLIPIQDTFIISASNYNYGADEILELGSTESARILIQFSGTQIKSLLDMLREKKDRVKATLHLALSEARNLPGIFSVEATTLSQNWVEGLGQTGDSLSQGASWNYTGQEENTWNTPGAFSREGTVVSQSVDGRSLLGDINLDITDIVLSSSQSLADYGICLKFKDEEEWSQYGSKISFYSKDTHTIYRPYLEFTWNDTEYAPGNLTESKDPYGIFPNNLRQTYVAGDIARINLTSKDRYASRVWSTSSIYQTMHVLPEESYWGVKDEYTNEMVIDFDSGSTKISADTSGSFFILDTSNLEPERYYRLLIQTIKDNQKIIVDNKNIFKIDRNGKQ